jgi:DNA polymerase-3 subunit alpha
MNTMDGPRFVHLHLHSEYSLLDGGNRIERLLARVKDLGMSSVAVTDHGNLHGAIELYSAAKSAGIRPILGIEAYVAPGDRRDRSPTGIADGGFHLVLLAENNTGWANLLRLSSDSFLNGFYYRPRMDKATLAQWADGLIAINGHLGSSIAHHLLQFVQTKNEAHWREAVAETRWHAETFGVNERGEPRFFIEIQRNAVAEQESINPHLVRLARELNLPLVADNDAHFLLADDYETHDTLCCISMGKVKDETNRLRYSRELYVKSMEQMSELFSDLPETIENTSRIADRCDVEIDFTTSHTPMVRVVHPGFRAEYREGDLTQWFAEYCGGFQLLPFDADDASISAAEVKSQCDRALRDLADAGAVWRYGLNGMTPAMRARLDRELQVLADKNISAYFLIVWDFVNWARQQGIPAAARGSGVGTMVGYVLGLSNACPERYGLLFERFTDPDRAEYPDIDVDICQDGRAAVINYVRQKYGHVAQIITFGRLKAKAAIKDVARVMGLLPAEGQRLSNLVPSELHITIAEALEKEPDFRAEYDNNPAARKVIDTATALEDHARHAGVHAAGVVIATRPLDSIVPLCRTAGGGKSASAQEDVVTQWDGPTCEKLGLLKMDFLGLRTLSTIERARTLILDSLAEEEIWRAVGRQELFTAPAADRGPHPLDLDRLTFDDQRVFDLFRRGETAGIFQFESGGMRKLLVEMKPDRIEDLIAANALYRPGPMDLIPEYCLRKHGRQKVASVHPIVDQFTAETYGIMVYQEQVMQIVHGLGDIPLRAAYSLIKAISKKKHSVIDSERSRFIEGSLKKGLSRARADELFELILKFAGYGFNKSHSTGYAIIAYQTAYLKTYFPNHYMAALLTYESAARKVEDWAPYLEDCAKLIYPDHAPARPHVGVEVLPPDVNLSDADFSVVWREAEPREAWRGHIRFGLNAIKGIGSSAIQTIVTQRRSDGPYRSLFDFCERCDSRSVGKAVIESLIKCGAFDSIHGSKSRAAMIAALDGAIAAGQSAADDRRAGQLSMFGAMSESAPATVERSLPTVEPFDPLKSLAMEKETLGFHVSGHPLDRHERTLHDLCTPIGRVRSMPADAAIIVGGLLARVRPTIVRNGPSAGAKMAHFTLQDKTGSLEGVAFSDTFARCAELMQADNAVVIIGSVDRRNGTDAGIKVDRVVPLADACSQLAGRLELTLQDREDGDLAKSIEGVHQLLTNSTQVDPIARRIDVRLHLVEGGHRITLKPREMKVAAGSDVLSELRRVLGDANVRIVAAPPALSRGKQANQPWKNKGRAEMVSA